MAKAQIIGKDRARAKALGSIADLERRFAKNVTALIHEIDDHIKSLTPVNTGQSVRNYIWMRDATNSVVYDAIDNGPPGPTNSMSLGEEPRRAVNEAAAAESLSSLGATANPFGEFVLANNAPEIKGLELGTLPGPPLRSRSPQGMFGVTESYFNTLVAARGMFR